MEKSFNPYGQPGESDKRTVESAKSGSAKNAATRTSTGTASTGSTGSTGSTSGTAGTAGTATPPILVCESPQTDSVKTAKTRKRKSTAKEEIVTSESVSKTINMLNLSIQSIMPDMALKDYEIKALSDPVSSILNRRGLAKTVNETNDYINLAFALIMIALPRIAIIKSKREVNKKNERKTETDIRTNDGGIGGVGNASNVCDGSTSFKGYDTRKSQAVVG